MLSHSDSAPPTQHQFTLGADLVADPLTATIFHQELVLSELLLKLILWVAFIGNFITEINFSDDF